MLVARPTPYLSYCTVCTFEDLSTFILISVAPFGLSGFTSPPRARGGARAVAVGTRPARFRVHINKVACASHGREPIHFVQEDHQLVDFHARYHNLCDSSSKGIDQKLASGAQRRIGGPEQQACDA